MPGVSEKEQVCGGHLEALGSMNLPMEEEGTYFSILTTGICIYIYKSTCKGRTDERTIVIAFQIAFQKLESRHLSGK